MHTADIVICGAGIMGLTIARELLSRGASDILILEKEPTLGAHASGRNSGVLHAGIYYTPGSERARTCIEGNRLMRAFCAEHDLPLSECGKVIVTTSGEQLDGLVLLHERANKNGAGTRLISPVELAELEPNARTVEQALHSPLTAVVDPKKILAALHDELMASGKVRILLDTLVTGIGTRQTLRTTAGDVSYDTLINASGAHSDKLAHAMGLGKRYKLLPFKGCYRKLKRGRSDYVRGNIYPVPDVRNPFLGVHFTKSVYGDVYIGPTANPAFGRENYTLFGGLDREAPEILLRDAMMFFQNEKFRTVAIDETRKYIFDYFFADARKLVRGLSPDDIEDSPKVGIRPQLVDLETKEMVMDFKVARDEHTVHILNAISPAFTSSMAFAAIICDKYIPL